MGALQGAAFVAVVLLLTETSPVVPLPQQQVDNRIVNRRPGGLLVPNEQNRGNDVDQSRPGIQQQGFHGPSVAQAQQNTRDPQAQVNQNFPNTNRPSRPPQQDSFVPQGGVTPGQFQPNTGRPQSAPAGFEPHVSQEATQRHSSCGIFPSPGQCQAAFPRYYYNASMSQCECYIFGGCDEAEGSYKTLQECHQLCLPERREEGPSCKHVYIENFHPARPSTPPSTPFQDSPSATHGPSFMPSADNGHNQPSRGRPPLSSPENTRPLAERPQAERPHGNINPSGGPAFQGSPNVNNGSPSANAGPQNFNTGSPNINTGSSNFNTGSQNSNTGSQNSNNGFPNFNNGSPNFNTGSPNINTGSPNVNNEQIIPSPSVNGHPVSNQPAQGSQAFGSFPENANPGIPRSPGNNIPNRNPAFPSEDVRFPASTPAFGVAPFVQPVPVLVF